MFAFRSSPVIASHTMTRTAQRIPQREAFADLRDPGSVRTARIAWPVTSAHLHLAAAADRIGSRFTLHNVVSSADHVLATHNTV